ncbi:MAG: hypothetical protein HZA93_04280 [Verrucomicrobia bacterium]|nr:hypothetical protein [Verrucomicrobiota bacterium]
MKSKPVVALQVVSEDVQSACDYFDARRNGGGDRFLQHYFEVADRIAANPEAFPVKFDDYHRALIPKTYLAAYYFIEPARTVIAAVVDARRHPRLIRDLVRGRKS